MPERPHEAGTQPLHLRTNEPVAERVLAPGDPGRALRLAQWLLDKPLMLNHARGLWGYTGLAADGRPLTVQSTGMGGPSAAIVIEELVSLGARRIIRTGTCGALTDGLELGDLVVAREVVAYDGTSRALGAPQRMSPDSGLLGSLRASGEEGGAGGVHVAPVATCDLFYGTSDADLAAWTAAGAAVVEMEAAALLAVAERRGASAACVLVVSDLLAGGSRVRIEPEALEAAERQMGELALAALSE